MSFNPRSAQIYIQQKTFRRLLWVGNALDRVADQVADELINEGLQAKYPQLEEIEKKIKAAKKEFLAGVAPDRTDQAEDI